jgi:hypothetical protein
VDGQVDMCALTDSPTADPTPLRRALPSWRALLCLPIRIGSREWAAGTTRRCITCEQPSGR